MTNDPAHAHRHRRERRARRQADRVLTAAVAAIGGGTPEDWPQEALEGVQDARKGVGSVMRPSKGRMAAVARKNGGGDE